MGREEGREGGKGERGAGARSPAQAARGPLLKSMPACLPALPRNRAPAPAHPQGPATADGAIRC